MEMKGKVLVAQGGGPTAVINQSFVGVVLEAKKYPQITKIYGALGGIEGIINEEFVDLTTETAHNLEMVAATPSSGLLSCRVKPDRNYCLRCFEIMKAHNVRYFFYIGGNDSSDTVRIINEHAKDADYDLIAIHIPKTIDNDLVINDHCPGFGSAARFVSSAFMGANLDNRALSGVYIGVVMGRHAGFLTAASCLAQVFPDDGPHLIYLPERAFKKEKFLDDVQRVYDKYGRCMIAVSEGIADKNGEPIVTKFVENVERDMHGNVQLSGNGVLGELLAKVIKDELEIKRVRADTFGYLQRSFVGCVSDVDQNEAREVGERAVHFAIDGVKDGSVCIERVGDYAVNYVLRDLEEIAGKTKVMDDKFINAEGNGVTREYYKYVRPLVGSGFQMPARVRANKVEKIWHQRFKPSK